MFRCLPACLLLTAAMLPASLRGEKIDVWRRVSLNTISRFALDAFWSQVTAPSGIECAVACSLEVSCHNFYYHKETSTCFLSPSLKKLNDSAMGELVSYVHFDGARCPLRGDYDLPAACLCWRLDTRMVTYDVARQQCEGDGATVLSIKTEERRRLVTSYLNSLGGAVKQMWVGATARDSSPTPSWIWADGDIFFANFSLWRVQPVVTAGPLRCVRTHPDGTYYLSNASCTQVLPYICEIVVPQ